MNIAFSAANILKSESQVIVVVCDCASQKGVGQIRAVTDAYAHVKPYGKGPGALGTIKLWGSRRNRYVLGVYTHVAPGKPAADGDDSLENRLDRFARCLRKVSKLLKGSVKSVAFPKRFCRGGAEAYTEIIDAWAATVPHIAVEVATAGDEAKDRMVDFQPPSHAPGGPAATPKDVPAARGVDFYGAHAAHGEFSNFYPAPFEVAGKTWPTSEHYFQAMKFADAATQEAIRTAATPALAKKAGGSRARALRKNWEAVKVDVMRAALEAKFTQHPELLRVLLDTHPQPLSEHTSRDSFWGDGGDDRTGENMLGRLLVELREAKLPQGAGSRREPSAAPDGGPAEEKETDAWWETPEYEQLSPEINAWFLAAMAGATLPSKSTEDRTPYAEKLAEKLKTSDPALHGKMAACIPAVADEMYSLVDQLGDPTSEFFTDDERAACRLKSNPSRRETAAENVDADAENDTAPAENGAVDAENVDADDAENETEEEYSYENSSLLELVNDDPPQGWNDFFQQWAADGSGVAAVSDRIAADAKTANVYPPLSQVFAAFDLTALADVKVVIIGQDPYFNPGEAMGLAFSVPDGVRIPSSLRNIYTELESDGYAVDWSSGDLTRWAEQGALLINAALTVAEGHPFVHAPHWESFTARALRYISRNCSKIVVICWGAPARKLAKARMKKMDCLFITSVHPSGKSAHGGFFGSKPFSKANAYLKSVGKAPIDWGLA
uniref:NADAR domain protein n=1 Tax=Marseillevirus LCMAC103 TaxID=2506604 RepID=A0A481YV43_9VIRU|nr:MAG: NADAR domain protein [Marseillevirus LCMAC103]